MPNNLPPIWQILGVSALVSAAVSWMLTQLTDYFRHKRIKVEHFEKLMLDRKFEAINRVWQCVSRLTADISPYRNGTRAFEDNPDTIWADYQVAMRAKTFEVYRAFDENALILGAQIWKVWIEYKQQLDFFHVMDRHSRINMEHLIRFCSQFPVDLKEAIAVSIQDPGISILTTQEETEIRKRTSAYLESNTEADG